MIRVVIKRINKREWKKGGKSFGRFFRSWRWWKMRVWTRWRRRIGMGSTTTRRRITSSRPKPPPLTAKSQLSPPIQGSPERPERPFRNGNGARRSGIPNKTVPSPLTRRTTVAAEI
ncbi:hypothetical protein ABFS83_02G095600 [Erythranthe nasuta]